MNATKALQIVNAMKLNHRYLHQSDLLCGWFCFHYIWIPLINIFILIDAWLYKEMHQERNKKGFIMSF
jgi:hypothetical protein